MSEPDSTPVSEDVSQETPEATTPSDVTIPRTSEQAARQEEALTDVRLDDDEENGNEASGSVEEDIDPTSEQDGLDEAEEEEKLESTEKEDGTATNDDDSSEGSKNGTISSATEQKDLPTIDIPLTDDNENINGNGQGDTAASMESESDPSTPNSHSRRRSKRAPSIALSISSTGSGQQTVSSMVFVKKALETISKSSDARKISPLDNAVKKALKHLNESAQQYPSPTVIFEPLRIVCAQSNNNDLKVTALDCIGKLFTFSYLEDPEPPAVEPGSGVTPPPVVPLIDRAITTVCDTYKGEKTDAKVELQIVKALMAAILNEDLIAHGSTLLKAIRQTYTIFVVSHSSSNQTIAQASLTQMVNVVFDRVKKVTNVSSMSRSETSSSLPISTSLDLNTKSVESQTEIESNNEDNNDDDDDNDDDGKENDQEEGESNDTPAPSVDNESPNEKLTLQDMEARGEKRSMDYEVRDNELQTPVEDNGVDSYIKDAFLVFRTMCKLSEKALEGDVTDTKSHGMRSKLISLHLIHSILKAHMTVFLSNDILMKSNSKGEESFVISVKDYLCSSLARNAASISPAVFEISAEIFWLVLSNLRCQFKKEIEVFFGEIYFPIMEMKTSTPHQKKYLLSIIQKLCNDPRALVELYLNYDCDRKAPINVYEHIIDLLVRMASSSVQMTQVQLQQFHDTKNKPIAAYNLSLPPALSITNVTTNAHTQESHLYPPEYALKMTSLDCLVAVLRSLLTWSHRGMAAVSKSFGHEYGSSDLQVIGHQQNGSTPSVNNDDGSGTVVGGGTTASSSEGAVTPIINGTNGGFTTVDDPSQFESFKHRKTALSEAISEFNYKPKKGLQYLIRDGFVESTEPEAIAKFLYNTEGLDKSTIGDYLGDDNNTQVMYAFVDLIDFTDMTFVDALRTFLQAFRLPGEAQKIDRFMLKFAGRFMDNNPDVFSNADTPYILAYSVILLNTDLHSAQIKKRMTPEEFIKNNRGINENTNLEEDFLMEIYNDILNNEIKLLSEQHAALLSSDGKQNQQGGGLAATFGLSLATGGKKFQREAYLQASQEMSNKTEKMFKSLTAQGGRKNDGSDLFYVASHVEHVRPMFEVVWMSFLAGLSGPFQEGIDQEPVQAALEGMRLSIKIACLFDIELPRISFVTALAKFTNLQNFNEMKIKNIEAIKILLETALSDGNMLRSSWKDVLTCVSQLERLQLISSGVAAGSVPDLNDAKIATRNSIDSNRSRKTSQHGHSNSHSNNKASLHNVLPPEIAESISSREIVVSMDRIFTQSALLSGDAIVDFVKALTEVSWDEIKSSGQNYQHPRTFSLQKMVDVCYYNMDRIRVEWRQLWSTMGVQFNEVSCHENSNVVSFALDSLRQLSMRFFDIEELPHFKFQKDFLQPFEYVMRNNPDPAAKDMVLQCLKQMILTKPEKIKSGWNTMFNVFSAAASVSYGGIVNETFDLVKKIHSDNLEQVIQQDSFAGIVLCLAKLGKNSKFQKTALHSVELLQGTIPRINELAENASGEDKAHYAKPGSIALWYPILHAFQTIIMGGEDLEVRSRALNYLFDSLVDHGGKFDAQAWDSICEELLFPIFRVLESRSRAHHDDSLSVWLSTTMIQALRNMIALLSYYFDTLERLLGGFLDLLVRCIDQENETVSKIGSSCLQQLVIQNVEKLETNHWTQIVDRIEDLFKRTTAQELLDQGTSSDDSHEHRQQPVVSSGEGNTHNRTVSMASVGIVDQELPHSSQMQNNHLTNGSSFATPHQHNNQHQERAMKFKRTIVKSILQLLMVSTVGELAANNEVFQAIPTEELLRVSKFLRGSYLFSKQFNGDRELRMKLWKQGYMKQMPNLLKQESTSALTYVNIMMKLYKDENKIQSAEEKDKVGQELIPQCLEILSGYNSLEASEQRYISTLWPVVLEILNEYNGFSDEEFSNTIQEFYPHLIGLLSKDIVPEVRESLQVVLGRVGKVMF